ncbi:MAG: hypothetical protein DRP01_00645 [Archaeoglobales archaeon]|nr:MAG: hypothetical protein DRP01_00645 [Archaeoglobales archaeon]
MCIKMGGEFIEMSPVQKREWFTRPGEIYTCSFAIRGISRISIARHITREWNEADVYFDLDVEPFTFKETEEILRLLREEIEFKEFRIGSETGILGPDIVRLHFEDVDLTNPETMRRIFDTFKKFKRTIRKIEGV